MRHVVSPLTLTLFIAATVGCAGGTPSPAPAEPVRSTPAAPSKEVTPSRLASGDKGIDADAEAYAQRLTQAIEASKAAGAGGKEPTPVKPQAAPGTVEWVDEQYLKSAEAPKAAKVEPVKPVEKPVVEPVTPVAPTLTKPVSESAKPQAAVVTTADAGREALLKLIQERVKDSHDPAASKALSIAGLALVDPTFKLDEKELAQLPPTQRELVKQFHALFASLGQQVTGGEAIDRSMLADRLNAIIGEQPLAIRVAKLCDRVRGFGVYEEMASDTFLAGREHPLVIYVELDHFKSVKSGATHQVKLSQELILFNESDGLAVWRQPEEQIVGEGRNQRRDFYVVQPTRLPARLGVGKYVLKVRVRDLQGGTRDEVSVPINVVADPALVKPEVKRGEKAG